MSKVFQIKEEKKPLIPAVTHVDGSGRLQTVSKDYNPNFYMLIKKFYEITEVPLILNTSFNLHGYPIILSPEDALHVFENSDIDAVLLNKYLVLKNDRELSGSACGNILITSSRIHHLN